MRFSFLAAASVFSLGASACGLVLDFDPPDPHADATVADLGTESDLGSDAGMRDGAILDGGPACRTDAQCDDGVFCNGVERCRSGTCVRGTGFVCATTVSCVVSRCDETTRGCVSHADDTRCAAGELCDPTSGCRPRPSCMHDSDCVPADACSVGACTGGTCGFTLVGCADTNPDDCLVPTCDASSGSCVDHAVDSLCEDGLRCTHSTCATDGSCTPQVLDDAICDVDGAACTIDVCDPSSACADSASGCVQRVDGTFCATFAAGVTLPGIPAGCSVGVCAPSAAIDAASGCAVTPFCASGAEVCITGGSGPMCMSILMRTCTATSTICDDGNPCDGVETCNLTTHMCQGGAPACGGATPICTVEPTSALAVCSAPIASCMTVGTLPAGADCPGPGGESCSAGLSCCYPCGIAGCTNQCVPTCTGPTCSGGCALIP